MRISSQKGFTLVELLVSLTIITILSSLGIASFVTYSRLQVISNATQDLITMLQVAKGSAESQVKPSSCTPGPLTGYQVVIDSATQYHMAPLCSDNEDISSKVTQTLPANVSFSSGLGYARFHTITGNVTTTLPSSQISIVHSQSNVTKTITIESDGRIHVQ